MKLAKRSLAIFLAVLATLGMFAVGASAAPALPENSILAHAQAQAAQPEARFAEVAPQNQFDDNFVLKLIYVELLDILSLNPWAFLSGQTRATWLVGYTAFLGALLMLDPALPPAQAEAALVAAFRQLETHATRTFRPHAIAYVQEAVRLMQLIFAIENSTLNVTTQLALILQIEAIYNSAFAGRNVERMEIDGLWVDLQRMSRNANIQVEALLARNNVPIPTFPLTAPNLPSMIFNTNYESTFFNWLLFIVFFGWIWMWF